MVETRSQSKTATDHTTTEVQRSQSENIREPTATSVRSASVTRNNDVLALPISPGEQQVGVTPVEETQTSLSKRPSPRCSQHSGNVKAPSLHVPALSVHSKRSGTCRSQSSHTSATCRAQMLAAEAEAVRRRVERERELARQQAERERLQAERERLQAERERELARLEAEAEQIELKAKLAALEARDKYKSVRSRGSCSFSRDTEKRTATWINDQNERINIAQAIVPGEVSAVILDNRQEPNEQSTVPTDKVHSHKVQPVESSSSDIAKLAKAINALSDRPKKLKLKTFSGDINQWMAFKCSYDITKMNFSSADNVQRLINALHGSAYQSVASLMWTSCDPDKIVDSLEQTFARPELLVAREIAELRKIPKISYPEDLNTLANKLRNFVSTINILNQKDSSSSELFRCILLKLSEHTRDRFTDYAAAHMPEKRNLTTKLELLSRFLLTEADKQLKYNFVADITSKPQNLPFSLRSNPRKETVQATVSTNNSTECVFCKQRQHSIKTCKSFLSLSTDDRWRWVREIKICYRCLKPNPHTWNNCRAKRCGVDGCIRRHNSLLHGTTKSNENPSSQCCNIQTLDSTSTDKGHVDLASTPTSSAKIANTTDILVNAVGSLQSTSRPCGLLKVVPIVLEGPSGTYSTSALLDEGSTATLIDGEIAARIGAKPACHERLRIEGVSGMTKDVDVSYVNFYIRGRNQTDRYLIENARAITPLDLRVQNCHRINFYEFVHLADISSDLQHNNTNPTVLIGAPDWHLSLSREVRCGKKNEPVASKTLLGWVLHGAISVSSRPLEFVNHTTCDDLDTLIKSQYDIDSLGITKRAPRLNVDDMRAVDIIESSFRQLDNGHFEVGLPWKRDLPKTIPDSYPQALRRFKALERQMAKDTAFSEAYHRFVNDIISKGYAEKCDQETFHHSIQNARSFNLDGVIRWYLPTLGVFHPQKKKLRVVHDAAATTKNVSLNNMLLQGPDLLCSLLDILFRFREGPVALTADIKEMFPQVKIVARDRDAQRFLWRNRDGALIECRMSSMIFGAVSSPFMALYIKDKNAKMLETAYPEACKAILHDHYMDDYLGSHSNVADAAQIAADIVTVHKSGGFEMRAWTSNNPEALSLLPKDLRSDTSSDVYLPPNNDIGVLGVKWNPFQDTLTFRTAPSLTVDNLTKRSLLSNVMKVYDPLGLLMPIIIWGRILIQKLWREGIDWDSQVPDKYVSECEDWFSQLQSAVNIKLPRWYLSKPEPTDVQLHLIADGGEQAYACVAFWRFRHDDGLVSTALIGSKARVAPIKPISIPRLELQAALIASRLAQAILHAHRMQPSEIIFWTDSTTVLKWIRSDARSYKPFVAHRLGEILETTNPSNWRWIPSSLNVADDATKPKKGINLSETHRWYTGLQFLKEPASSWPTEQMFDIHENSPDPELKSELVSLIRESVAPYPPVPDHTRFSSWLRLLRATARIVQGARLFRLKLSRPISPNSKLFLDDTTSPRQLHVSDIVQAEKMLLQRAQIDSFPEELALLTTQTVPKSSRLYKLGPVLDRDNLIRMDTRIKSAPGIEEGTRAPLILDGRHQIVRLLILHHHIQAAHIFNELVLNELRQRFWILKARSTIRSVANACLQCRRWRGRPINPTTGDLPLERLDHHKRPFTHVALDYFGPITITVLRRHEKRYVALFTCLVTRALHLELVTSLSSDAAIMCLRRFIARRGAPSTILSDNGTNFVGAARELRLLLDTTVIEYATNQKIDWRFIPPASPFMGGAWERLVRTVKTALRACLCEKVLKEDVLVTLLLEAEAIVNSRPLTYVPSSPDAPEALTPFHFLLGSSSVVPWTCTLTDSDLSRRCDWRRVLRLADQFWARWLREYLPTLRPRGTPRSASTIGEGDVVLIADHTLPRGLWPLGRVVKVYRGPDGAVRVADVSTRGGTLRRPARKLILLVAEGQSAATGV